MNAIELADQLDKPLPNGELACGLNHHTAKTLRRQHEAIVKLREALEDTAQTLVWMQWGDCRKFTQRKLLTVHEAVENTQQALADTEEI